MFILYVISSSVTGRTQLYYLCEVSLEIKKKKKKICQRAVKKLNSTMASIQMIIGTNPMKTSVNLQSKKRTRRTSSGVLPFIGEISKVLFGTVTENDVRRHLTRANLNARQLNYLG